MRRATSRCAALSPTPASPASPTPHVMLWRARPRLAAPGHAPTTPALLAESIPYGRRVVALTWLPALVVSGHTFTAFSYVMPWRARPRLAATALGGAPFGRGSPHNAMT
ncbi:hypothetical protein Aab01nite_21110 [Paractinoplanes abujensis]|nr:hypothetical protein Aab01nite_21110 [Actinoplanes abujensis]